MSCLDLHLSLIQIACQSHFCDAFVDKTIRSLSFSLNTQRKLLQLQLLSFAESHVSRIRTISKRFVTIAILMNK